MTRSEYDKRLEEILKSIVAIYLEPKNIVEIAIEGVRMLNTQAIGGDKELYTKSEIDSAIEFEDGTIGMLHKSELIEENKGYNRAKKEIREVLG